MNENNNMVQNSNDSNAVDSVQANAADDTSNPNTAATTATPAEDSGNTENKAAFEAFKKDQDTLNLIAALVALPEDYRGYIISEVKASLAEEKPEHPSARLFRSWEDGRELMVAFTDGTEGKYKVKGSPVRHSAGRGAWWEISLVHVRTGKVLNLNSKEHRDMVADVEPVRLNSAGSGKSTAKGRKSTPPLPETIPGTGKNAGGTARVIPV